MNWRHARRRHSDDHGSTKTRARRALSTRGVAAGLVLALLTGAAGVVASAVVTTSPAVAAAGNPGVPGDPTVLFEEDFENRAVGSSVPLLDYVGTQGTRYTAQGQWALPAYCNGFIVDSTSTATLGCSSFAGLGRLTTGLGVVGGDADPTLNAAAASYTAGNPGGNLIQFQTVDPLELPAANRFLTFSVDAVATSCTSAHPLLRFYFTDESGATIAVQNAAIDPCTAPVLTGPGLGTTMRGATFTADGNKLLTGTSFGIQLRNGQATGSGNDGAYDNIRVLDVTPQLDKSFSPESVPVGQTSTLTLTVTNTSELGAKDGWAFTDNLPTGLVVADEPNLGGTCDATTTATAGGASVAITDGSLAAAEISCTVTVDVTSASPVNAEPSPRVYENCAANFSGVVGMNLPDCATVAFFSTPALEITKTSDAAAASRPGDVVSYTVTATNVGNGDYTAADPAVLTDDLADVLDDAVYGSATATIDGADAGAVTMTDDRLGWSGPLTTGQSVTIGYTVTLAGGGDGTVRNVAFGGDGPTPACDPSDAEGLDPDTGVPCAATVLELPKLTITKTADRETLPAVGQEMTYTVTVTNTGSAAFPADDPATFVDDLSDVLDDATLDEDSIDASAGAATVEGSELSWSGELGTGDAATITYTVIYRGDGDHVLMNAACLPADDLAQGAQRCSSVVAPGSGLTQWKTAVSSSTPTVAGSTITYTLSFRNDGQAPATVDSQDYLLHVDDDADVADPVASEGLAAVREGDQIHVTGAVPSGETSTVTYEATILPDGERGDSIAANFLAAWDPATEQFPAPPTDSVCAPADEELPDCTQTPIGSVEYSKTVAVSAGPLGTGTVLTYRLTANNPSAVAMPVSTFDNLSDVLDDATINAAPVSDNDDVTVSDVGDDGVLSLGGSLQAGQQATVTYTVTINDESDRGNNRASNFLVDDPTTTPPAECADDSDQCTSTPLPRVTSSKSVDPAAGSSVSAGDVLTYTLSFTNDGEATGAVDYTDYLAGVLDDAELTDGPTASDEALEATLADDTVDVTGSLAPDQTVTVEYQVTVLPDAERADGDNLLGNFLAEGDAVPSTVCADGDSSCTTNPISKIESWKTVEASEAPVKAGTTLIYTLHFENTGQGAGPVDAVDDLTQVLDDAEMTTEPSSEDGLSSSRTDALVAVSGDLGAGDSATVTYAVTITPDAERADDIAANYLLAPGEQPPTGPVCQPTDAERPSCTVTPIGKLIAYKSVSASADPVVTGTTLTYTLTFDNQGQAPVVVSKADNLTGVLDDATITTVPSASADALDVSEVVDGVFTVTGELGAGQVVTVSYTAVVNGEEDRGDNQALNVLLDDPTEQPPTGCTPDDDQCTSTALPNVTASKSVTPGSGSPVAAGDVLTYTLSFTNTGTAAGPVDYTDYLTGVLDDAQVVAAPAVSLDTLSVTDIEDARLRVTGTLAEGASATVTYQVAVNPEAQRGDNRLDNVLARTGETPRALCDGESPSCTSNPMPQVAASKSVDPPSGTPVVAGQTLTYTLTFANTGTAPGSVAWSDDLTYVLDDATLGSEIATSGDGLSAVRDGDRIAVTGDLTPGETATVSYEVTVKAADEQGDQVMANYLLAVGQERPSTPVCESGETACTTNPVGVVSATKTVDAGAGSTVDEGQKLVYTLTFTNTGAGSAPVAYTDDMSEVLDDATLVTGPEAGGELSVDGLADSATLTVAGKVAPGETATVTYAVQVKDYEEQGDHRLVNHLTLVGQEPPGDCVATDPLCTSNAASEPPSDGFLPRTGGVALGLMALGLASILGGALLIGLRRRAGLSR